MEKMLGRDMRTPISLKKFQADYIDTLHNVSKDLRTNFCKFIPHLEDHEKRLNNARQRCSLEQLDDEMDARVCEFEPGVTSESSRLYPIKFTHPKDVELRSFNKLLAFKNKRNPFGKTRDSYKMMKFPPPAPVDSNAAINDIVITVRVYRPARATHIGRTIEKPMFAEEFVCLGSNLLTALRDKISCICNKYRFFDISNNPDAPLKRKLTDPGYFFITDTFYNDKRNPKNPDYSKTVRTWSKKTPGLEKLSFHVGEMQNTRFRDLTISVGFPQLYQHHGNCQHVFVFSQVMLLTPNPRNPALSQYPYLRSFSVYNMRNCSLCGMRQYAYVVEKSDRHLHDPAYLCYKCFHSFHYVDGRKVGEFRAYRIIDLESLDAKKKQSVPGDNSVEIMDSN